MKSNLGERERERESGGFYGRKCCAYKMKSTKVSKLKLQNIYSFYYTLSFVSLREYAKMEMNVT